MRESQFHATRPPVFQSAPLAWRAIPVVSCHFMSSSRVSIRALAWRAIPPMPLLWSPHPPVSIRRPRVEGDHASFIRLTAMGISFNPRPRVEGDRPTQRSVHRGAEFQSAPSRGGRYPAVRLSGSCISSFNPRPRVEGDLYSCGVHARSRCFNPRPRVEGDYDPFERRPPLAEVSIRAPSRGGRSPMCLLG